MLEALPMYQRIGSAAFKADLENARKLDEITGNPHKFYKTIHVAGTNGKGSVSHMLASVLQHSGYKVGLYTSPHLLDFRERIRINGKKINKEFIIKFIQRNMCFFELIKPSFFEMSVFMAFCYFKINKVDIAVIETGLGGRLDTTNVINPIVSVITNIGFDHTHILGNSLKVIAKEKAGIIKPEVPVVIGETDAATFNVFESRASLMQSPIYYADQEFQFGHALKTANSTVNFSFVNNNKVIEVETDLLGNYQYKNIATCLKTIEIVNERMPVFSGALEQGLKSVRKSTGIIGRWHEYSFNPLVICDIAHNREGLTEVLAQIYNIPHKKLHFVLGFVDDKNLDEILTLFPKDANYYFTRATVQRSHSPELVNEVGMKHGIQGQIFQDVNEAFQMAMNSAGVNDMIYIGGSTFVVADFLASEKKLKKF